MANIVLDNLIFDLQPHGGITSIWEAILHEAAEADDLDCAFLQASRHDGRLASLIGSEQKRLVDNGPTFLRRFRNPRLPVETKLFHSSYFRVCRNSGVRNIVTVHDCITEKFDRGVRRHTHLAQKRRALRCADCIICVSNNTRNDLLSYYPWLDPKRLVVIHNGIDLNFFTPGNTKKTNSLLYVGARSIHKNFALALELIAFEVANGSNRVLDVIGGGPATQEETAKIRKFSLTQRVRFLGSLSREQLLNAYRQADALIYPSFYEGFGIPPLEAMACGCPVLCSNRSSLPEVVGDAALLFEPEQAKQATRVLNQLDQPGTRDNMINRGLRHVAQFDQAIMTEKTLNQYRKVMKF
jgi:glycosyltransferase involved in cell wall biosynthesis